MSALGAELIIRPPLTTTTPYFPYTQFLTSVHTVLLARTSEFSSEMVQISYLHCNQKLALYLNLFHICEYFQINRFLVKNSTMKGVRIRFLLHLCTPLISGEFLFNYDMKLCCLLLKICEILLSSLT